MSLFQNETSQKQCAEALTVPGFFSKFKNKISKYPSKMEKKYLCRYMIAFSFKATFRP